MTFETRRKLDTGDVNDYVVKINQENIMCAAFKKGSSSYVHHDKWDLWTFKVTDTGDVNETGIDLTDFLRSDELEMHGWFMWSAWFAVGLLLLFTKRYAKKTWTLNHYLHAILGYFTLVVTIVFALRVTNWAPFESIHNALGSICVIITIFGSLSGTVTAGIMRAYNGDKAWSEQEKVQRVARIHRYAGYVMLFIGNASILTGVGHYFGDRLQGDERRKLGIFSFVVFCILVVYFEAVHRIRNKYSMGHVKTPRKEDKRVTSFTPE